MRLNIISSSTLELVWVGVLPSDPFTDDVCLPFAPPPPPPTCRRALPAWSAHTLWRRVVRHSMQSPYSRNFNAQGRWVAFIQQQTKEWVEWCPCTSIKIGHKIPGFQGCVTGNLTCPVRLWVGRVQGQKTKGWISTLLAEQEGGAGGRSLGWGVLQKQGMWQETAGWAACPWLADVLDHPLPSQWWEQEPLARGTPVQAGAWENKARTAFEMKVSQMVLQNLRLWGHVTSRKNCFVFLLICFKYVSSVRRSQQGERVSQGKEGRAEEQVPERVGERRPVQNRGETRRAGKPKSEGEDSARHMGRKGPVQGAGWVGP